MQIPWPPGSLAPVEQVTKLNGPAVFGPFQRGSKMVADRQYTCYITYPSPIRFLAARLGSPRGHTGGKHCGVDWDAREGLLSSRI